MNDSDIENPNEEEIRPKKRSLVWQFFEKISRHRVRCRLCQHEQNYQGTTGNILRHLKARHDLDATIKGQQDPRNQQRIKQLSGPTASIKTEIILERKQRRESESDISDTDPYVDAKNQEIYDNSYISYENFELKEDCLADDDHQHQRQPVGRKSKLEEDRIIAETEYFREKAAYFRLQKHLTVLHAKKIKLEIEQMSQTASNKIL